MRTNHSERTARRGAIAPLVAVLMIPLLAMVALAVDLGYIKAVQSELQNTADAAALAGTSMVFDRAYLKGETQSESMTAAREEARRIAAMNRAGGESIALDLNTGNQSDGDIVIGRLNDPRNRSEAMSFADRPFNSLQVRVRRDATRNGNLDLFFARIFGYDSVGLTATATATYEDGVRGFKIPPGSGRTSKLLPFALEYDTWELMRSGVGQDLYTFNPATGKVTAGGDGIAEAKLFPDKGIAAGNFGTVNIGKSNNSTKDLSRQILHGPSEQDMSYHGGELKLDDNGELFLGGDPGISAGIKDELAAIIGQPRVIPIYKAPVVGNGNNAKFRIIAFVGIIITDAKLTGSMSSKHVTIQPEFVVDPTAIGGGSSESSTYVYHSLRLTR